MYCVLILRVLWLHDVELILNLVQDFLDGFFGLNSVADTNHLVVDSKSKIHAARNEGRVVNAHPYKLTHRKELLQDVFCYFNQFSRLVNFVEQLNYAVWLFVFTDGKTYQKVLDLCGRALIVNLLDKVCFFVCMITIVISLITSKHYPRDAWITRKIDELHDLHNNKLV